MTAHSENANSDNARPTAENAGDLLPPMGICNDRDMLNYLAQAFASEMTVCERCGHSEGTETCDSARFLRDYLAAAPRPTAAADAGGLLAALKGEIPLVEPVYIGKALRAGREARVSLSGGTGPQACVMLVNIQLTPWIQTADTAAAYADGYNRALRELRGAVLEFDKENRPTAVMAEARTHDSTPELRNTLREIVMCYPWGSGITLRRDTIGRDWTAYEENGVHKRLPEWQNNLVNSTIAATTAALRPAAMGAGYLSEDPFMWAIMGPGGKVHFDEMCVSGSPGDLSETVYYLNDEQETGDYIVVPVYTRPTASGGAVGRPVIPQPAPERRTTERKKDGAA